MFALRDKQPLMSVISYMNRLSLRLTASICLAIPVGIASIVTPAAAQPTARHRVTVTDQGARVTLSIGRAKYPRGALVSVTVTIRNVSHHTLYVPASCDGPGNPFVEVRSATQQVFPPYFPVPPPPSPLVKACKAHRPTPLESNHLVIQKADVILRASHIVAHVGLGPANVFEPTIWVTARLFIHLATPDGPTVTITDDTRTVIHTTGGRGTGTYLYSGWEICPGDNPANGARIVPALNSSGEDASVCPRPLEWHGLVGRLNHSLTRFDYTAPTS